MQKRDWNYFKLTKIKGQKQTGYGDEKLQNAINSRHRERREATMANGLK